MNPPALYNLSPLAMVMLTGVLIALVPLAWTSWSSRGKGAVGRFHALATFTLFLTFDLVLFGAFTRLTDSGLGCPDWPGCYGSATPFGAASSISDAQSAMPTGPVTHGKAWIEMIHRYLATAVGVLILFQTVQGWILHCQHRRGVPRVSAPLVSPWWPTMTLVWVCLQGAFGALTVTMKLFPAIVTLHLLGGMVLLMLLAVQVVKIKRGSDISIHQNESALRFLLAIGLALLVLQIALGGWVSTNYAVLACNEFPTCQGQWWPVMDVSQGFELWRPLGTTGEGEHISFAALTAIHWVHRLMAMLVFAVLGFVAWKLRKGANSQGLARWLMALLALQFVTGVSNVVFNWPLLAAVMHTGGAAALCVVLTWALASFSVAPAPDSQKFSI